MCTGPGGPETVWGVDERMKDQRKNRIGARGTGGFTLAELLIVVAIIAVLIAIAIPVFRNKLERAREAYDIYTMRQAASAAIELYYEGITDNTSATEAGLAWWGSPGAANANAWGVYNPVNGRFIPTKNSSTKPYGKGTKIDGKTVYTSEDGRKAYDASLDYTDGVVMVAIYPNGNNKHVDIYWKYTHAMDGHTDNAYIGGDQGASNPRYSLRIPLK